MIFETRPVCFAVDLHRARAELKVLVDQIERVPRERDRQERTEVARAVFQYFSRDHCPGRALVSDLDVRILLVVFEEHIEYRLVLLDQI